MRRDLTSTVSYTPRLGHFDQLSLTPMDNLNNTYSLRQLFNERRFRVPDYQRGYSWDKSNIADFLDDLKYLSAERVHYTGTMVLHTHGREHDTTDRGGDPLQLTDIVDGQQRLTTAVILLDCIRRALNGIGQVALADGIKTRFITTLDEGDQPIHRLTLNSGTNTFFQRYVLADELSQDTPDISSEVRLKSARLLMDEYVQDEVSKLDHDQARSWLRELEHKITNRLRFSLYEVDSDADVGIIFEVMNDRGKPLTQLEMVKNYMLYAGVSLGVVDRLTAQVNEAWSNILSRLMRADLERSQDEDRLLRTHWVTKYSPRPRDRKGIHSVKARFDVRRGDGSRERLIAQLSDYVNDLEQTSVPFCDANKPSVTGAFASLEAAPSEHAEVVEWSSKIARLGTPVSFQPLLIAVRLRHPQDAAKYLESLKLCEAYAFRVWTIQGARSNAGQSRLFRKAHELRTSQTSFEDVLNSIKDELAWRCGDVEFNRLLTQRVEDRRWYGWRGLKYFLYEYEVHLAKLRMGDPEVKWETIDRADLADSIEHILPQSIENVPYWTDRFSDEDHRRFRHDIGNLTLSRFNSSLSNRPFPEKKGQPGEERRYRSSPFFQERDLADYEDWTPATIVERRQRLIDWALQRWSVDFSDVSDDRDEIDEDDLDDLSEE